MTRSPRWSPRLAVLVATAAIVFAACGGRTASTRAQRRAGERAARERGTGPSRGAFTPMVYPETGEAPCGQAAAPDATHCRVHRQLQEDHGGRRQDRRLRPVQPGRRVPVQDRVHARSRSTTRPGSSRNIDPARHDNQAIVVRGQRHRPVQAGRVEPRLRRHDGAQRQLLGRQGQDREAHLPLEHRGRPAPRRAPVAGTVDGIDNVGPTDFDTVKNNPDLQLKPRAGLNIFYFGFNNTFAPFDNEKVRQAIAMGIDRQRIVDNFYAPGSEVATHFTPCAIPNGCAGEAWYEFDPRQGQGRCWPRPASRTGSTTKIHYRDVVALATSPIRTSSPQDIQAQLKNNLDIDAKIEVQESGTFLDNAAAGKLDGIHLLGWGADYPDITNFLDYHFGAGSSQAVRRQVRRHHRRPGRGRGRRSTTPARKPAYEAANNAIKAHVPMMPICPRRIRRRLPGRRPGRPPSPLGNENFAVMTPGDRTQFVFMQNAEPPGLYCADETDGEALRVCEQMIEALYAYEIAGTAAVPALATECKPNAELTRGPARCVTA